MIRTFGAAVAGYPCFYLFLFDKFMVNFGCENVQKNSFEINKKKLESNEINQNSQSFVSFVSGVKLSNENKR